MKKIIAFITAALMAVSMAVPAMAEETSTKGNDAGAAAAPAETQGEDKVEYPLVNPDETGSITVHLYRPDSKGGKDTKSPVSGVELYLYRVAEIRNEENVGYHFYYTDEIQYAKPTEKQDQYEDFDALKKALNVEDNKVNLSTKEAATTVVDYIDKHKLEAGESVTTNSKGEVVFSTYKGEKLPTGVYLIRDRFGRISPFLVTVPTKDVVTNENGTKVGKLIYDVNADPKVDPVPYPDNPGPGPTTTPTPTETPTPTPTEPLLKTGEADPPVEKVIAGDKPTMDSTFYFTLTPENKDNPMPEGTVNGKRTVSIKGAGRVEFGKIKFEKAGTYKYTVKEEKGSDTGYTYDDHSYQIIFNVDENLKVSEAIDGKVGETITITNRYKAPVKPGKSVSYTNPKTPTPSRTGTPVRTTTTAPSSTSITRSTVLPQTGQLWWPVWVLMAAGGVFVVTGMLRRKKN